MTGLSVTLSLIVFVIGIPIALGWLWVNRLLADAQRVRCGWVLGARAGRLPPPDRTPA